MSKSILLQCIEADKLSERNGITVSGSYIWYILPVTTGYCLNGMSRTRRACSEDEQHFRIEFTCIE